jgi:hypothetical protein
MHVEATPSVPELVPELLEPLEPLEPPEPPELLVVNTLPLLVPVLPPSDDGDDEPEPPQAPAPTTRTSDTDPTSTRRRAGEVRSFMTFPPEAGAQHEEPLTLCLPISEPVTQHVRFRSPFPLPTPPLLDETLVALA